jgi:uncharacterized protein
MSELTVLTPTPFREYVVKVHSRCNLACDYCYMYELADQSARTDVAAVSPATFDRICERIGEHVAAHGLTSIRVVLHGGEPMLVGSARLARMAARVRSAMPAGCVVDVSIQTNAVLIDQAAIDAFGAAGVRVGVSLDGDRTANDLHRRYADGRSSFDRTDRALRLLSGYPEIFAGILCVVDLNNDPVQTYRALLSYSPERLDLLLPHANWQHPPVGTGRHTPYGSWLAVAFDRWYDAPVRETRVRIFEEIIHLILGGPSRTEAVGLSPVATIVVNVDGAYEQIDTLRSAYQGAVGTGLNIFGHSLDQALHHPAVAARQSGVTGLAQVCRRCPVHRVCGGGYYPHRFRPGNDFDNASVYCADLRMLIEHIAARLRDDVARRRETMA